jgi:hypothetical protein
MVTEAVGAMPPNRRYATKRGERPRSLAVRCVCQLMPQCSSSRSR